MCTYNAGQPRQELQGLYLTDGKSLSVNKDCSKTKICINTDTAEYHLNLHSVRNSM